MTVTQAPAADQPSQTTINDDRVQPGQASSDLARQDLYWNAIALPDGKMLAAAAARLLGRLSALAVQGDGGRDRPDPAADPRADKAAALTLIKAAHQLLCTAAAGAGGTGKG